MSPRLTDDSIPIQRVQAIPPYPPISLEQHVDAERASEAQILGRNRRWQSRFPTLRHEDSIRRLGENPRAASEREPLGRERLVPARHDVVWAGAGGSGVRGLRAYLPLGRYDQQRAQRTGKDAQ